MTVLSQICKKNQPVKKFWKSVNNWQSYRYELRVLLFGPPCACTDVHYNYVSNVKI